MTALDFEKSYNEFDKVHKNLMLENGWYAQFGWLHNERFTFVIGCRRLDNNLYLIYVPDLENAVALEAKGKGQRNLEKYPTQCWFTLFEGNTEKGKELEITRFISSETAEKIYKEFLKLGTKVRVKRDVHGVEYFLVDDNWDIQLAYKSPRLDISAR